ncbi:hypothetical protein BaRGS_00005721 [Batillaria attramentaria]|uniref:Uncharacterized protein n=1 Tax=Batillaria attramentaria TaxID=370345 RepID=A0ABD0LU87_9CAEN
MGHWMFKGMARAYRQRLPSVKRYFAFLFLVSVAFGVCFIVYVSVEHSLSPHDATSVLKFQPHKEPSFLQKIKAAVKAQGEQPANVAPTKVPSQLHKSSSKDLHRGLAMAFSPTNSTQNKPQSSSMDNTSVNYNVHIFYYPWYGNPQTDGQYLHWNHRMLPHWKAEVAKKYPQDVHVPPDDIGSNFYPQLGPYSSADPATVNTHMAWIRSTGAGT